MKLVLKLEELAMFVICFLALDQFNVPWWCYLLLIIGPDISFAGYLGGNRIGAFVYNFFHHKGIAIVLLIAGFFLKNDPVIITGLILFGHSSMDRFFGYGLKHIEGFKYTHLGQIGNK